MYPVLFTIGGLKVTTFGLMVFLSFMGGAWATGAMLKRYGLPPVLIWDMLAWIALSGIAGAKLYYLALHSAEFAADPLGQLLARDGLVWYGGLMGGVLAYYLQIRARALPRAVMFDATGPAVMLSIGIGRIGCFLVGDDYGQYTEGPFGIAFPKGSPPSTAGYLRSVGDAIPAGIADSAVVAVHPTQLYEVLVALLLFAFLWWVGKKALRPGRLFSAFMALYGMERFLIEIFRAKGDRYVFGLSTAQTISLVLLGAAWYLWWRQGTRPYWHAPGVPENAALRPAPD